MERLIKPKEAAKLLGVRLSTIYAWSYRQKLPSLKVGSCLRFSSSALGEWLEQQERPVLRSLGFKRKTQESEVQGDGRGRDSEERAQIEA